MTTLHFDMDPRRVPPDASAEDVRLRAAADDMNVTVVTHPDRNGWQVVTVALWVNNAELTRDERG